MKRRLDFFFACLGYGFLRLHGLEKSELGTVLRRIAERARRHGS
jgi:hypothetical protein